LEWVCASVYDGLNGFLKGTNLGMRSGGTTAAIIPQSLRDSEAGMKPRYGDCERDKADRDEIISREFLGEICFLFCHRDESSECGNERLPAEDELVGGLKEMMKTDNIPIWLVFAVQVHLGVRYILDTSAENCHEQVLAIGHRIHKSLTTTLSRMIFTLCDSSNLAHRTCII
jgi:hypothetical protein